MSDITITKEYLDRIRSFAAIQPNETFTYVPKAYRDLPDGLQPKFTLQPVSGEDVLRFSDSMRGEVLVNDGRAEVHVRHGEYTILVVRKGLKGWSNYYTLDGDTIKYDGKIDCLPRELLEELSEVITGRSSLTKEEVLGLK